MYTLYTDKNEIFAADIAVKNASLKNSIARLIIESSDGLDLVFKGSIQDGKCNIPIRKLKGLLDESAKGNMHLEIIVEDVYFKPWESDFVVEEHTSVKVSVKEQKEISKKPLLEVKVKQPQPKKLSIPATELIEICKIFEIDNKNFKTTKKQDFKQIIKEYFKENKEFKNKTNSILNEVVTHLK